MMASEERGQMPCKGRLARFRPVVSCLLDLAVISLKVMINLQNVKRNAYCVLRNHQRNTQYGIRNTPYGLGGQLAEGVLPAKGRVAPFALDSVAIFAQGLVLQIVFGDEGV